MPRPLSLLRFRCCFILAALAGQAAALDVWFGSAPFCTSSPTNCHTFDLEFVRKDDSGSGVACTTGQKALCRPRPLDRELVDTPKNDLVVVAYNAFELPYSVSHDGQAERTCHIPRALLNRFPDADIIILNEIFLGGCIQDYDRVGSDRKLSLMDLFEFYGFHHSTDVVGEKSRQFYSINGGTFIVSRWPIAETKETVFNNYAGTDRLSSKGAVYAKVMKQGEVYHVVGTHLQSSTSYAGVRQKQAHELSKFIAALDVPSDQPVIIGGDFNCDRNSNESQAAALLQIMQATLPTVTGGVTATYDYSNNGLVDPKDTAKDWLDYVVYSKLHRQPDKATLQAFRLKADTDVTFCSSAPLQPIYVAGDKGTCRTSKTSRDLSDHFPVLAKFSFNSQ